ncbi:MAG: flagellar export chaperone FliS [Phycisphaerales bacterium]|nr:flagellar export chaperone FliS [Planctomycetota bacterium]MCH8509094.1 flagellar export chaperone FliS [Phycisphaerales bacterium]
MSHTDTTTAYLRSKVMSASPEELRLMLLDGALRFAHQARTGLESKNYELTYSGFSQCRAIVMELINTINASANPELGEKVRSLYAFFYSELITASFDRDIPRLDKVIELLEYERETWAMLMERLVEERRAGVGAAGSQPGKISLSA